MQEILKGRKCFLGIDIAQVGAVQNAVKIDTHIISPSGVVSCVANGYDELEKVVGLMIPGDLINELGVYSIDLRLVFADSEIIVPTFAFAEAVEGEAPCYGISEVYVKIEGGEVVPSGSTIVEFVNREEFEQLSNKVEDLEEQIGSGGGSGASDNNYTDADKELVQLIPTLNKNVAKNTADIKTKQDTLTLTTKPNGNIVIGNLAGQSKEFMPATPSGDPMHYAYETEGAVYNGSDVPLEKKDWFGKTIIHEPHKWYLNGLGDISNKEMAKTYSLGRFSPSIPSPLGYGSNSYPDYATTVRTNIARLGMYNGYVSNSYFASTNYVIETINVSIASQTPQGYTTVNSSYAFNNCLKLRSLYGVLKLSGDALTTFVKCYKLQDIKISSLSVSISFADSPLLSKESLLYMINNCASNASFTITLHPDVYDEAKDSWTTEIEDAIEAASINKGTTITLASA